MELSTYLITFGFILFIASIVALHYIVKYFKIKDATFDKAIYVMLIGNVITWMLGTAVGPQLFFQIMLALVSLTILHTLIQKFYKITKRETTKILGLLLLVHILAVALFSLIGYFLFS